jgi:hypothetical protein
MGVDRDVSEISAENELFAEIRSQVAGENGHSWVPQKGPERKNSATPMWRKYAEKIPDPSTSEIISEIMQRFAPQKVKRSGQMGSSSQPSLPGLSAIFSVS